MCSRVCALVPGHSWVGVCTRGSRLCPPMRSRCEAAGVPGKGRCSPHPLPRLPRRTGKAERVPRTGARPAGTGPGRPHGGDVEPDLGTAPRALSRRPSELRPRFVPGPGWSLSVQVAEPRSGRSRDPFTARFYSRAAFSLFQAGPGSAASTGGSGCARRPGHFPSPGMSALILGLAGGAAPPQTRPSGVTPGAPSPPRRGGPAAAGGWVRGGPGLSRRASPRGQRRPWRMVLPPAGG